MTDIARIWKVPCHRCGCHVDVNLDEGLKLFEVSDPIVWDGTDEAFKAIREALAHGKGVLEVWLGDDEYEPHIEITSRCTLNRVGLVVHGAGVRIEGDSFVILPPEKDGDA